MIQAGLESTDPFTGTRLVVIEGAKETDGWGWIIEVHCPEEAPPAILEHVHLTWKETFEILHGEARYVLGGKERFATTGDTIIMPAGIKHIHPWNGGTTEMVYRQMNDFGRSCPEAVHDVLGAFATINGMAREGKIGKKGLPKNPLQFAATLRTFTKHESFDAAVPISAQRIVSASFGRLAEMFGYRGVYPRYLT